ncbi:MAG: UvrD-helicase domain-containing protein [Alphaproteobacteria bacterium]|nr:UvrD-helicase domain-containing protein [Alphaproteobacteria bacterium]
MTNTFFDFNKLNPEQRQAVETTEGPVLVLSGAGTGKTTVLTARLAYIIQTGKALPFQCLAVTFTNKAAKEMQERLAAMIGEDNHVAWLGTFHKIGLKILRNHPEKAGLSSGFNILDSSDQERLLKQIMTDQHLDLKDNPPQYLLDQIQRLKDQGLTPEKAERAALSDPLVIRLYRLYQERLRTMNTVDFGDLLLYCLELFHKNPEILTALQKQFKYILVDEYQDTNIIQYLWLRLLTNSEHNNICCVGDDDQSIYSWRGAEIGNILRFEEDFPNAAVIRLESNYRSTAHILAGASGLIAHNKNRLGKTLHPAPGHDEEQGDRINIIGVWNGEDEAQKICGLIEREQRHGTKLSDIAVLVRAGFQTRVIEEALLQYGLPYKIIAGMRFYEREEIRDATAYIRLLVQPKDDMAFTRIVNKPRRGVGEAALAAIRQRAAADHVSLYEAASILLQEKGIKGAAKTGLERFLALYDSWRASMADKPADEMLSQMLEESGYLDMRRSEKTPESEGRLENLKELIGEFKDTFDTFENYLEYISLVMDNDNAALTGDYVSVMTLHAAKGLEFDTVFLPGWEEGIFPHQKSLDEGGSKALEEERRLAYVGITRARKRVYISFAGSRRMYNQWQNNPPSRFLSEIPKENVEMINVSYGYNSGGEYNRDYTNSPYSYKKKKSTGYFGSVHSPVFSVGTEVYHERYGYGTVVAANGSNTQVVFEDGSTKTVLADYLENI